MPRLATNAVPAIVLDDRDRRHEVVTTHDVRAAMWRIAIFFGLPALTALVSLTLWSANRQRDLTDTERDVIANTEQIRANTAGLVLLGSKVDQLAPNLDSVLIVTHQVLRRLDRKSP